LRGGEARRKGDGGGNIGEGDYDDNDFVANASSGVLFPGKE
jgi:hypothetical protein